MKEVIVLMGILPILLALVLNFGQANVNSSKEQKVIERVYTSVQLAKQDGCFTAANLEKLKLDLSKIMEIDEKEVIVIADQTPRYRVNEFNENELIYYNVTVPVKKVIAGNKLFGISDKDNIGKIVIENKVASERLRP